MPVNFEGGKLMVNRGLSNHFQVIYLLDTCWFLIQIKTPDPETITMIFYHNLGKVNMSCVYSKDDLFSVMCKCFTHLCCTWYHVSTW